MKLPTKPPSTEELFSSLREGRLLKVIRSQSSPTVDGQYFHWEDLRYRDPPEDSTREEWWMALKWTRGRMARPLPFNDVDGHRFTYVLTDEMLSMLHRVDRFMSGQLEMPTQIADSATRDRYLVSGMMEEAISSSLLEGAPTTRRDAKELLRSGRHPRTKAEIMVVNNYRTVRHISHNRSEPLTVDLVKSLHVMVTEGTLDNPDDAGRLQTAAEERVEVGDPHDPDIVFHRPPRAEDLPDLMERFVSFSNTVDAEPFVHPVIRAIVLHFALSYIHPFVDGNGRTARAMFYRSMLRQGYWLTEYVSISRLLNQAPSQYARSFLYVENDDADMTYFLLHQLKVICRGIDELFKFLEEKAREVSQIERVLRRVPGLNRRQLEVLSQAVNRPNTVFSFATHKTIHDISYGTARADLLDLEVLGYLERRKMGRAFVFYPVGDLPDRVLAE